MFNFGILRECMLTSYVLFGCSSWGSSVSIPYLFDKWVKKSLLMFAACWMFLIPFGNLPLLHCDFIDFLNVTFFGGFWNPGTVGRMAVCCMDENDLPTASLQLELKKSPPVTYKCVNHPCLWQEFQVIALFPACVHCLFLSGTIDIIVCSPLLQKFSSDGRAAKHIHTKIPWRFPSIMIDVQKCLYIFSYVQNRWYVWLKTHGLYFTQAS